MFPKIEQVEVVPEKLAASTREAPFVELSFNLLREAGSYVCLAASITGPNPAWDRDQSVVGGNMVRIFKLISGLLDQASQDRLETSVIFARLIFETCVNVRYLVVNFSPELVDSYIRHSLRHERKLNDKIQDSIRQRGGAALPVEERMLKSLERTERIAGVALSRIDLKDKSPWGAKHLHDKAKHVGLGEAYLAAFGGLSHNVHGSWQDIYQYQLATTDDEEAEFRPNLEWARVRPQYLFGLAMIVTGTVGNAARFLGGEYALSQIVDKLSDLELRIKLGSSAHEAYLSKKRWPEI
jgi:hypothetical protein